MAYRFLLGLVLMSQVLKAQVFMPSLAANGGNTMMLDYQIYSTHGGNGSTSQYELNPSAKAEFDKLFNTSNTQTTLYAKGKLNSMVLFDWDSYADLTSAGISIPNSGNYFSVKIRGTFIPTETGIYTFAINGDDGVDLSIENTTIVNYYGNHAFTANALGTYTGNYNMTAGKSYNFELRMQEASGGEGLQLYWKAPSATGSENGGYKKTFTQYPNEILSDRFFDGSSALRAAPSAQYIKNLTGTEDDKVYWINLPVVGPTQVFLPDEECAKWRGLDDDDESYSGNTFQYSSSYWTMVNTLYPSENNRNDGDAKFETMNYFPAKDLLALFPGIPSNYNSSSTGGSIKSASSYNNWCWLQNDFNKGIRITPVNFWNKVDRLFVGDANNFAGKGTVFSSQISVRFYGFNYYNTTLGGSDSFTSVRWGFGWNENDYNPTKLFGDAGLNETSPDVSGGIGVTSGTRLGTYSAGDTKNCCENYMGINQSARVEIYVR